jgi:hypothetical protein
MNKQEWILMAYYAVVICFGFGTLYFALVYEPKFEHAKEPRRRKKRFSEEEVDRLIRATINETAEGVFEWFKNETNVVDKQSREILDDSTEIDVKKDKKGILKNYIYPRLEKHGITIS